MLVVDLSAADCLFFILDGRVEVLLFVPQLGQQWGRGRACSTTTTSSDPSAASDPGLEEVASLDDEAAPLVGSPVSIVLMNSNAAHSRCTHPSATWRIITFKRILGSTSMCQACCQAE